MLRVMSRGAVEVVPVDLHAVAEPMQIQASHLVEVLHVVRVEHGHRAAAPLARIEPAVAVAAALALARLADADVRRMVGIRDIHALDAVDAFAQKGHVPDHVDARRELHRIEPGADAHVLRIPRVDDAHARLARDDIDESVLRDDLTAIVEARDLSQEARLQQFRDVEGK